MARFGEPTDSAEGECDAAHLARGCLLYVTRSQRGSGALGGSWETQVSHCSLLHQRPGPGTRVGNKKLVISPRYSEPCLLPSKEEQSTGQPQHPKHSSMGSWCAQQAAILPWCVLFAQTWKKRRINLFKSAVCFEKGRFLTCTGVHESRSWDGLGHKWKSLWVNSVNEVFPWALRVLLEMEADLSSVDQRA